MTTVRVLTLQAAHELLIREWPGRDASRAAWLTYYRRAAELYGQAVVADPGHENEARFWAGQSAEAVRKLEAGDE